MAKIFTCTNNYLICGVNFPYHTKLTKKVAKDEMCHCLYALSKEHISLLCASTNFGINFYNIIIVILHYTYLAYFKTCLLSYLILKKNNGERKGKKIDGVFKEAYCGYLLSWKNL